MRNAYTHRNPTGTIKLFHYLLICLAGVGSDLAADLCLEQLRDRPEETHHVLHHIAAIGATDERVKRVTDYAKSDHAIYDYQLFQIVNWFLAKKDGRPTFVQLARKWAFDMNRSPELRCVNRLAA